VAETLAAGFDVGGVAAVPDEGGADADLLEERFAEWVAAGRAGGMEYLKRADAEGRLLRGSVLRAFPWARSVVVAAVEYGARGAVRSIDEAPRDAGWIARYAWSGTKREQGSGSGEQVGAESGELAASDYHDVLLPRLQRVEIAIKERFGAEIETRCYVDTGPLVERAIAAWAGVGWIGKNTCVLNEERGSWLLLGVIVTSLELEREAWTLPAADRCGTCTRCMDACPTGALIAPREMDAARCIAYLTIEHKGGIEDSLRGGMGRQVFGCDICQDVCPWNAKAARRPIARSGTSHEGMAVREELINPALAWLAEMDNGSFKQMFHGSPLERTGRKRVQRNLAIAMGNSGEAQFLAQLAAWAGGADAVLAEAAGWAIARIQEEARNPEPVANVD
jgi:epoxyqueuosine reductase